METPKHCLEAVVDAVKVLDLRAVALMDLADQFARFSRQISRAGQAANN